MGRQSREQEFRDIVYKPLQSQRRFHQSKAPFKGFSGPVGSGKSAALVMEALRLSYVNPGRLGLIGAPTYPMLRDATQRAFIEALENNEIPYELNKSEQLLTLHDTDSKILFRSLEEHERLRGTNLSWFGVDELTYCSEEAWVRLEARLRDPYATQAVGFAVWTPKGFDWVHRRFIGNPVRGYELVRATPMENSFLLASMPDFYQRLEASYDAKFYQQEVLGEYLNVQAGQAYHAFSRTDHVGKWDYDPAKPLHWSLDFNVDPMSSVVAQVNDESVTVLDEISLSRATTWEACEAFFDRYQGHRGGLIVHGDASGSRMGNTGWNDFSIMREFFRERGWTKVSEKVPRANPPVRLRVNLVNSKLRSGSGEITLRVDARCKELIKDLEEVVFIDGTQDLDKSKDWKRTHLSDALGYMLCSVFEERRQLHKQARRIV